MSIMHTDITRAYFYIDAVRDIYAKLPAEGQEDHEYDMYVKLVKPMYGTSGTNIGNKCPYAVQELGIGTSMMSRCRFYHQKCGVCGLVHRDDFVFICTDRHFKTMFTHMAAKLRVKWAVIGRTVGNELRVLSRSIE